MKKVIVISTSLRAGSNSDMLADKFIEGALQAGHEVEKNLTHRKRYTFLPRVPGLPETGQVCDSGRCRCIMQILLYTIIRKYISFVHYLTRKNYRSHETKTPTLLPRTD